MKRVLVLGVLLVAATACSSSTTTEPTSSPTPTSSASTSAATTAVPTTDSPTATDATTSPTTASSEPHTYRADVWADNWFALYVNGVLVGEDSVPITTERSFNAETITFTATPPLLVAMVTKDYMENESGLEYIGLPNQQIGDGGFIAQITDVDTGRVVAGTDGSWRSLVVQRAPLDPSCVTSSDPVADCGSESVPEPDGWTTAGFDDSAWTSATTYTAEQVGTKDGYDTITWDPVAELIWSADLELDNVVLWRAPVASST